MKKIINMLAIVAIVLFAGYNVYQSQKVDVLSDIAMENVEALAWTEVMLIKCDLSDFTVSCTRRCIPCGRLYVTVDGFGYSLGFKGTCKCGASY